MSRESVYIIGGGASGISCAARLRRLKENCDVTIVEQSEYIGYSTAALPLFISGKIGKKEILLSDYEEKLNAVYNINVLKKSEVTKIDRTKKIIYIKSRDSETSIEKSYDKIVFSTGCRFNIPNLFGANSDNFFKFSGLNDAIAIKNYIDKYSPLSIAVIGLNRVSLPLVNELANCGFVVNAIDSSNKILPDFNDEFDYILKEEISKAGVKIFMNNDSLKFSKNEANSISKIEVSKQTIDTQMVIYCDRIIPNSVLAKNSGLDIGFDDGIIVDDKMATSDKNIYACGSVTESINMVSKQKDLSHTVNLSEIQGRIAASNLAGLNVSYKGILKTTFVSFNKLKMGSTGLNLSQGKEAGFDADSITIYN
nr:FAD-dependent oxidoreductase [Spirochaetota bacterium]